MLRNIIFIVLSLFVALPLAISGFYLIDKRQKLSSLESNSRIFISTTGNLEYRIKGSAEPQFLFVHGTPGGIDTYFELEDASLLIPSRPGYLGSELRTGESAEQQARAFSELLEHLDIDSIAVLAISGGGPQALAFARLFPEKTQALILIEAVSLSAPEKQAKVLPLFESDFMSWLFISYMELLNPERVLLPIMPDQNNRKMILEDEKKIHQIYQALWSFWPVTMRSSGYQNDWKQFQRLDTSYHDLVIPTLIIHGDQDRNVSANQSITLARQIPDAHLEIVEGADHYMTISHSEQIQAMINAFLGELGDNKKIEYNSTEH